MHPVTIRYADDVEKVVQVFTGETLLAATRREGIALAHQCMSGSCGTCVCRLEEGQLEMTAGAATCLLPSEHADGLRLACVASVKAPSVIALDYPSTLSGPHRVHAFINRIEWLAPSVAELELELADGDWMAFEAGQFVRCKVPGTEAWRSYSMSSTEAELPILRLLIRCLENGIMSDYLRERAQVEDVVELEGAFGSFRWHVDLRRPHIMIAGGTGVAPMVSMLDTLRARSGNKPTVLLSFGCNDVESLFFDEQLALRSAWMPKLEVRVSLERADGSDYRQGNPVMAVTSADIRPDTVAYLCGPPPMIEAASNHLLGLGLAPENIHAEQFRPSNY